MVKPILKLSTFEYKSAFTPCEFNIPGVIAFYVFLRELKKITIRWKALATFRTTGPSANGAHKRCNISNLTVRTGLDFKSAQFDPVRS